MYNIHKYTTEKWPKPPYCYICWRFCHWLNSKIKVFLVFHSKWFKFPTHTMWELCDEVFPFTRNFILILWIMCAIKDKHYCVTITWYTLFQVLFFSYSLYSSSIEFNIVFFVISLYVFLKWAMFQTKNETFLWFSYFIFEKNRVLVTRKICLR